MPEKLNEDSKAVQMIRTGLKSGIIKSEMPANAAWDGSPDFQQYKLDSFRTRLNRIKQEMREFGEMADVNNDDTIVNKSTEITATPPKKTKIEVLDDAAFNGFDNVVGQTFSPMEIQSVWTDPVSTTECLTVAVWLPFGVRPRDVLSVRVLDGGRELDISIMWPKALYNISVLHKKWLNLDTRDSLALYPIESVGRVPLRIKVQQHIFSRNHLGWYDDAVRVLYVDLKAPTKSYGMCKDDAEEAELI